MDFGLRARLLRGGAYYAACTFGARGIAFLLVPVFTAHLSTAEYGLVSLSEAIASIVVSVLLLAVPVGVRRQYFKYKQSTPVLFARTSLLTTAGLGVLAIGVSFVSIPEILGFVAPNFSAPFFPYLATAIGTAVLMQVLSVHLGVLQAEERAATYAMWFGSQFVVASLLAVCLVVLAEWGALGVLYGRCIAAAIAAALVLTVTPWERGSLFDLEISKKLVGFSAPLVLHSLVALALNLADRLVLEHYWGLKVVGQYHVAYALGMTAAVVTTVIMLAWTPLFYRLAEDKEANERQLADATLLLAGLVFLLVGLGSVLARPVFQLLTPSDYHDGAHIVSLILGGYYFHFLFSLFSLGVLQSERTRLLAPITALSAVLNLGLNILWIPKLGMQGAAWATLLAYLLEAGTVYWLSRALFPIAYPWRRLAVLATGMIALSAVVSVLSGALQIVGGLIVVPVLAMAVAGPQLASLVRREPSDT